MAGAKALGEKAGSLPTMGRNAGGNKLQAKKKDIWITANTTHRHRRMCLCRCRCTVGVGVRVCVCACVREGRLAVCSPSAICDQWTIKREIRSGGRTITRGPPMTSRLDWARSQNTLDAYCPDDRTRDCLSPNFFAAPIVATTCATFFAPYIRLGLARHCQRLLVGFGRS